MNRHRSLVPAFVLLACLSGCGRNCPTGHYEPRHVEESVVLIPLQIGDSLIMMSDVIPAHDRQAWVCDRHGDDESGRPIAREKVVAACGVAAIPVGLLLAAVIARLTP